MELLNFELRGEAKAVLGFINILATTIKKEYKINPAWWAARANILGFDMSRDPQRGLGDRLLVRRN